MITVTRLLLTAVKGTRVQPVEAIELDAGGARGDRRFYVVDERGQMRNGKQLGALQQLLTGYDEATGTLTVTFPDGTTLSEPVVLGPEVDTRWFSRPRRDRLALGPWSEALSAFAGQPLRLIGTPSGVDRGARGRVSAISRGSLARLASAGSLGPIDGRRFRMLIEVDGVDPHGEDAWIGRDVRIGEAVLRWHGNIGRCLVTGRDPESGEPTLPTLDLLGSYRRSVRSTEPLPFGIHGAVVRPGVVRVGDPVASLTGHLGTP